MADKYRRFLATGEWLFREGDPGDTAFVIENGLLEICREHDGNRERIAQLGPGDLLGETSLLTGERITYPVVASTKCLALCLPAEEFRELIMTHPHVLEYVGEQAEARRKVRMI